MKRQQATKAAPSTSSTVLQLILAGFLIAANLFCALAVQWKKQDLDVLDKQKRASQITLKKVRRDQRAGMLAMSIFNEQGGWENAAPVAALLLDYLSHIPKELRVSAVFIDRPLLLRPLPEEKRNAYFLCTLALAGTSSFELEEAEPGQAKYIIPGFLEETSSNFDADFTLNRAETETGTAVECWNFSTQWSLQPLWKDNLDLSKKKEGGFDG